MQLRQISGYIQSIYFAVYDDKILLLDGCCKADVELIFNYITKELNRPIEQLKAVVVTHMHPDHAGAANTLKKRYGCSIISGDVEGQWYNGFSGFLMYISDVFLAKWVAKRLGKPQKFIWYFPKINADFLLKDNQKIPGFEDWTIIETHGHTDRDISLYHQDSKTVYVADLTVKVKGKFIPPFPVFYPKRYLHSLAKIERLKPNKVVLAHGGEVVISHDDYKHLISLAPKVPMTLWRTIKSKLTTIFKS